MSKGAKKRQKEKRLVIKRGRKAANKAHYEELQRLGQNQKSKRAKGQAKRKKRINTISHPNGPCGNIGCKKCDPCGIHKLVA